MSRFPSFLPAGAASRWSAAALVAGMAIGGAGAWWLMSGRIESEARRLARAMAGEEAGARKPPPPGTSAVGAGAGTNGRMTAGGIPVIAVTDNLEEAYRQLLAIKDPAVRQAALLAFLDRLPVERWGGFLLAVRNLAEREEFEDEPGSFMAGLGALESVFSYMMKRAPGQLLSLVMETRTGQEANDDAERDDEIGAVAFRFWAGHDFPAALDYFERHLGSLPPDKQSKASAGLAREFVKHDPAAAFAWIARLPQENQAHVTQGAFQTLSHVDSQAAMRFLVSESELPGRDRIASEMAKGWAATEPEKALAWAKQLPDDLATHAIRGALGHLAEKDFDTAARETAGLPPAQQDEALMVISHHLKEDPRHTAELIQLVEAASEGSGRAFAAHRALEQWARADLEAASAWVAAQPEGGTRDQAINGFSSAAVTSKADPEAGLEWTATVSDPDSRRTCLWQNIQAWSRYDANAARAWIQSSPRLSDDDREFLLPLAR